ncbi:MAG: aminoglycoside phosphotransferase family protein [Chloroflexi bacterium]|nr:aminoglycoside phosphotransferase family protein [Chloroflexota bacterium]
MSRTGVEAKPLWASVPPAVRAETAALLGSPVRRAARIWGGYGPTPTFRLRLADGRGAFFKAVDPSSNEFMHASYTREVRIYRELGGIIAPWAPVFYGAFEQDGWRVALLEDLGPQSVPPWTRSAVRGVARAVGEFHRATLGVALPAWLPQPAENLSREANRWVVLAATNGAQSLAGLAGRQRTAAGRWLDLALPSLIHAARGISATASPHVLMHGDIRSDNLRWSDGRLHLFDWPHAGVGPAEYDAAAFAQTVTVEGGPAPEEIMAWYSERAPVRTDVLDASVAAIAGFFADQAWRPEIPGLPRLRRFQRQQLAVSLAWAARRLRLPDPTWLRHVSV